MQILNDLRRAGLVDSRRGQAGGYLLARSAETVTLRHVVEAVDPVYRRKRNENYLQRTENFLNSGSDFQRLGGDEKLIDLVG